MSKRRQRKCLNCKQLFRPNPRNLRHQRYCTEDACRRASKTASQRRWLNKAENRDYFCGPDQLARVQHWRSQHPGYARRGTRKQPTCWKAAPGSNPNQVHCILRVTPTYSTWIYLNPISIVTTRSTIANPDQQQPENHT